MEEKAPFLATPTTTTKTRVTRAALVLCMVAAVVVGVTFLSGHIMAGPVRAESVKSVSQFVCLCYFLFLAFFSCLLAESIELHEPRR